MFASSFYILVLVTASQCYMPLRPPIKRSFPPSHLKEAGEEPLYLTPYIESGDLETGRSLSVVDWTQLEGLTEPLESYSGLFTVDPPNNGNMFFWFFPALNNPETAPVVIWLQGGPGRSSMFGALKLHGPVLTTVDEEGNLDGVRVNPNTWARKHNIIYIDNPVGAGFSFSDKMPTTHEEVADILYEFLQQWFQLFPEYQSNPFYPFGQSYAGKWVPNIARKIHEENKNGVDNIYINLTGVGIGDGLMSPYHEGRYANYLYSSGLLDANQRDECLAIEEELQNLIKEGNFSAAYDSWSHVNDKTMDYMHCYNSYNMLKCDGDDPFEYNYEDFCNLDSTRLALHVGDIEFNSGNDVYRSMMPVIMTDSVEDVELCLENYRTLIYNGMYDIIVHHTGVADMILDLNWSG